ncbi:MAG TPA: 50S ribosomal protein L5 [Candidatus Paceibacterota bacterium]|nr:50S ribosomal protein L5 [Candidatus Paceibacterota bacterium]
MKKSHLKKIVVNIGLGKLRSISGFEDKILPEVMKEVALITGQKPAPRAAKKSIAGFKTREGDIVGLQTTLRGKRMQDFFIRLISFVLPRVKDFRGLPLRNVDHAGNLNIGFKDQLVFPEIVAEKSKANFGLQVTVVTDIKNREKAIDFYKSVGVPLQSK